MFVRPIESAFYLQVADMLQQEIEILSNSARCATAPFYFLRPLLNILSYY